MLKLFVRANIQNTFERNSECPQFHTSFYSTGVSFFVEEIAEVCTLPSCHLYQDVGLGIGNVSNHFWFDSSDSAIVHRGLFI